MHVEYRVGVEEKKGYRCMECPPKQDPDEPLYGITVISGKLWLCDRCAGELVRKIILIKLLGG